MRVAMVLYTSGASSGGAAKHFRILPPLLEADARVSELALFMPKGALDGAPRDQDLFEWEPGSPRARMEQISEALRRFAPDVVFIPTARYFPTPGAATVVMVRNMEPLETPFAGNTIIDRVKNIGRRAAARLACRRADRIIAVSDHVRDFLVDRWRIPPAQVGTVSHGVSVPDTSRRPASAPEGAPFLFSMGSIRPARGLIDLVEALADERLRDAPPLLFAGKPDKGAEAHFTWLQARARELGVEKRIIWAGQLSPPEVAWCFRNARLFVMTSRAEACPNTVLEALSHASQAVSGDNAPMPEFFGDAALYYRNGDGASLANAMATALALPQSQEAAFRQRAAERAAQYTWEKCAQRTVDELEIALSRRTR